jgi:hypothetical protein
MAKHQLRDFAIEHALELARQRWSAHVAGARTQCDGVLRLQGSRAMPGDLGFG